jgi:hypothetical protein
MWWNDVLKMIVVVVVEGCLMPQSKSKSFGKLELANQFGKSVWQIVATTASVAVTES